MNETLKPIKMLAVLGIVLHTIWAALQCAIVSRAEVVLALMDYRGDIGAGMDISTPIAYIYPLFSLAVFALLTLLLLKQLKGGGKSAGILFLLMLVAIVLLPVIGLITQRLHLVIMAHSATGAEGMAALSMVQSVRGMISHIDAAALPCLAAASGMNWYRCKFLSQ